MSLGHRFGTPCKTMENVGYIFDDVVEPPRRDVAIPAKRGDVVTQPGGRDISSRIEYFRPNFRFKEIIQSKAIPFLDLVGNVGGFIGIFVGYSVLQFFEIVLGRIQTMKPLFIKPNAGNDMQSLA